MHSLSSGSDLRSRGRRADGILILLVLALATLIVFSLTLGRYSISALDALRTMLTGRFGSPSPEAQIHHVVVEVIRMPRILAAVLCGMGLALSGAVMQSIFRNPLVGPEIAGVSSGASFGGVLAIMLSLPIQGVVATAFLLGAFALMVTFGLSRLAGRESILALVLSGVIVGGFFSALTGIAQYVADPQVKLPSITYWLMGSFASMNYNKLAVVAGISLVAGTVLMLLRWRINLLALGDADATALGVNVPMLRWVVIAQVALIVAAQVSVSGGVGFVGLVIPHIARMLVGPEHTRLLPASALLGGIYLLAIDDIARSATREEIPIGLLTSLIGMPIFAWLFWKIQGHGWSTDRTA